MEAQINRIAIAGLESQYNIPRSVLHDRMNALHIQRTKIGNKAYIDSESLQLLNELNAHMKAGHPMALFLERIGKQSNGQSVSLSPSDNSQTTDSLAAFLLDEINETRFTIQLLPPPVPPNPWDSYEQLELIASHNWLIPTSRLLPLLNRKSIPKLDDHNRFRCMGFVFWRMGKAGREFEWHVKKI